MSNVVLFMATTLDGYFEGPNQEFDWPLVDDEFNEFSIQQLSDSDGLLFGRKTFEFMASYWQSDEAKLDDPVTTELMNAARKTVFSSTLKTVDWNNSRVVREDTAGEIRKMRAAGSRDLLIFGSNEFARRLTSERLIDEYRIMVNPVALGGGRPLLSGLDARLHLRLGDVRTFRNGNVLLSYTPVR